jgi:hypothetical protein
MICKRKLENTIFTNRLTPVAQKEQKCWKILNEMLSKNKEEKELHRGNYGNTEEMKKKPV